MTTAYPTSDQPLLWDIFCRVIDNYGDLGVCWRLSADLAARGQTVRLWVDDASALEWMAPGALQGQWPGIAVIPWHTMQDNNYLETLLPADVWVEGFGCEIAIEMIANMAINTTATGNFCPKNPVWINLEYLSAEPYVQKSHNLPSPVLHGPAQGCIKHFYFPGFTPGTGGLLREPGLGQRQQQFNTEVDRIQWLGQLGKLGQLTQLNQLGIDVQPDERWVSLFCYEPAVLAHWLGQLAQLPGKTRLLVTHGRAQAATQAALLQTTLLQPTVSITYLPALSQLAYDQLLWCCDINCVRGEDSLVRALWAGKPLLWQAYPQSDAGHRPKIDAFLDWLEPAPSLRQWQSTWNGFAPNFQDKLTIADLEQWRASILKARTRLMECEDLTTGLMRKVQTLLPSVHQAVVRHA
jgi:uncharacterized repeat protein (TIGR03837 family)